MASITRRVVDDPESGRIALLGNNGIYRTYVELNDLPDGTDRVELVWVGPQFSSQLMVRAHGQVYRARPALQRRSSKRKEALSHAR